MIKIGIIGLGNIARRFEISMRYVKNAKIYAIASKNDDKIAYFQSILPDVISYHHYQDLIDDPNIDAIYIALPHALHFQWAKAALNHHKHVLCEKPSTLSVKDTKNLIHFAKSNGCIFMEAMKTRFIPFNQQLKNDLKSIGKITYVEANFCSDALSYPHPSNWYLLDSIQGGALYDVGPYPISFMMDILGTNYQSLSVEATIKDGIDYYTKATFTYPSATAVVECAINQSKPRMAYIKGSLGTIEIPIYNRPTSYTIKLENQLPITKKMDLTYDDMYDEIVAFIDAINTQTPPTLWNENDMVNQMKIIEDIRKALESA